MPLNERPAVSRRRLRSLLRRLRADVGETQKQAADALEWSTAKLMRLEGGKTRLTVADLRALLSHYRIVDEDRIKELEELVKNARRPTLAGKYGEALREEFKEFLEDEEAARTIRQYEPTLIPGPLQTEEYARAALTNYLDENAKKNIELRIQARLERKDLLKQDGAAEATFILDEAAIRRKVGAEAGLPDLMERQLQHLKEMSRLPNVTIQVVPFGAGIYPALSGPFVILEFDDVTDANLLYREDQENAIIVRNEAELIERHLGMFSAMEEIATPADGFARIADSLLEQPDAPLPR